MKWLEKKKELGREIPKFDFELWMRIFGAESTAKTALL
jgi:hypothetical protein